MNSLTLINLFQAWNIRFLNKDSEDLKFKHEFWLKLIKKNDARMIDNNVLLMTNLISESYLAQSKLISTSWVIEIELSSRLIKTQFKSEFWNWIFKLSHDVWIKYLSWVKMLKSSIDLNSRLDLSRHEAKYY